MLAFVGLMSLISSPDVASSRLGRIFDPASLVLSHAQNYPCPLAVVIIMIISLQSPWVLEKKTLLLATPIFQASSEDGPERSVPSPRIFTHTCAESDGSTHTRPQGCLCERVSGI